MAHGQKAYPSPRLKRAVWEMFLTQLKSTSPLIYGRRWLVITDRAFKKHMLVKAMDRRYSRAQLLDSIRRY